MRPSHRGRAVTIACLSAITLLGPPCSAAEAGRSIGLANGVKETPLRADSLADSVGVNVNLATLPAPDDAAVASLTKSLGIRHIRIPLLKNDAPYDAIVKEFAIRSGTRVLGITDCPLPLGFYAQAGIVATDIAAFQAAIGGYLEAYEAVNEPDTRSERDPHWASHTVSCMSTQSGALPGVPYLAPAIANEEYAPQIGNVSKLVDRGNIHRYFSGNNPGTSGWGDTNACGVYGSLSWAQCEASLNVGPKPKIITETGYNSSTEVDGLTQAKYLGRELFVNLQAGIARTYIYCMNSYTGGDGFGGSGLLETNLAPKPAFTAIEHVIALFKDEGSDTIARAPITYSILTAQPTIRHELFQKRDGTFLLAVWNETASWKASGGGEIRVPKTPVTVGLPFVPGEGTVEALDDRGDIQSVGLTSSGTSSTFSVDDHVAVFAFKR